MKRLIPVLLLLAGCGGSANPLSSPLSNLSTPMTMFDRTIEARATSDIAADTGLFVAAGMVLTENVALNLSMEVYEQRLLVTGLLGDGEKCARVEDQLRKLADLKELYWHVLCIPRAQRLEYGAIGDFRRAVLRTKVGLRLLAEPAVSDVNLRVSVDSQRAAIVLGRLRSDEEKALALAAVEGDGINRVVDYIQVRP